MRGLLWIAPLVLLPAVAMSNPDAPSATKQINIVTFKVSGMT
jgi:hypothetical protein